MYHHVKKLMYTVRVDEPDPKFGNMLLEQFGGANGELAAAMQYSIQGLNCEDPARKDLLMDIGTEELSHLEIIGSLARLHLKPTKFGRDAGEADPLVAIAGGGGVNLFNSQGNPWTADYLKITGELDVDLRSNIAAEARAKIVYERLINFCNDVGTRDALQFLMTREITHMKAFTLALESLGKGKYSIGEIPPTRDLVDQYFNDSTGQGDQGEIDARGPWNEGDGWDYVESPVVRGEGEERSSLRQEKSVRGASDPLEKMFAEDLSNLNDTERQILRALPKMIRGAHAPELKQALETHRRETEEHVERLKRCFEILGSPHKSRQSKGIAGLLEEGEHILKMFENRDPVTSDLALIEAAQKVEHYEISAYESARTLAQQIHQTEISTLLAKTLAEEEHAASVLSGCALPLVNEAKLAEVGSER